MTGPTFVCFDMRMKLHFLQNADKFVSNRAINMFSRSLFHGVRYILVTQTNLNQKPVPSVLNLQDSENLSSRLLSKNLKIKLFRNIILRVVLCGCETWSLTLREERKLRVFENMVLRIIFGPRREEVMGKWRRMHNKELNDLYSSPSIVRVIKSRRMGWAGYVVCMGEERGV